jgi:hypothetical protein
MPVTKPWLEVSEDCRRRDRAVVVYQSAQCSRARCGQIEQNMRLGGLRGYAIVVMAFAISVIAGTGVWRSHVAKGVREREMILEAGVGLAFADSLENGVATRPFTSISSPDALSALYLERLRLGLGSPFRLIDQVLRDPALDSKRSAELGEAMLARTMMGDAYRPRPAALNLVSTTGATGHELGTQHQAIIDSVIASHTDPRVGELAVRLAYRLASASGTVSGRAPEIATAAAAQSRDRILSMRDARALFTVADRDGISRLTLMKIWRTTRKFDVERPVIVPLTARDEQDAVATLPALLARIESAGDSGGSFTESARTLHGRNVERARGDALPNRMAAVAAARDLPPLAAITVAVRGYSGLIRSTWDKDRLTRLRFIERISNEETLAAEFAVLTARASVSVPEADAAILTAAVALRPFAQERAWLPGDPAPTVRDLQARFGVTVSYDAGARANWRPFYQRTLEHAILDMRRVLPGFEPRGLRVHFGTSPLGDRALALHDPIRRTIYFPPVSHSGVMAHEFAHDLDWQAAKRAYGGTGWYRTDHALRQSVDRLAGAVRQMASAPRSDSVGARMTGVARPTEVLARNVDWFVSASLAREGRINGHLSAAQDPVLTGYASAITPEAARDGGSATLRALDGLTLVPEATRDWFSGLFGAERRLSVHEAVRRVLEAPLDRFNLDKPVFGLWGLNKFDQGRRPILGSASWTCLVKSFAGSDDAGTIHAAVQYAAESRAKGVVRQWAEFANRRPYVHPARLRALSGAPWDPAIAHETIREIRDAILWSALSKHGRLADGGFGVSTSAGC